MLEIRKIEEKDFEVVSKLNKEIFGTSAMEDDVFHDLIFTPHGKYHTYFIVLTKDNKILGYAGLSYSYERANIEVLGVDKSARELGYGIKLIDELYGFTYRNDIKFLYLNVSIDLKAACQVFQDYGFQIVRINEGFYGEGKDSYFMRKSVDYDPVVDEREFDYY